MQITDLATEQKIPVLLRLAFRPLFLLSAGFAVLAMALWAWLLTGTSMWQPALPVIFWHSHEMIFGFGCAVIAGFLLTAMQNWTGLRAPHGKPLLLLVLVWLVARLLMLSPLALPWLLVSVIDLAFLPIAAYLLAKPILAAQQHRNLFFVPLLVVLTICNGVMWLGYFLNDQALVSHGSTSAVFLVVMVMAIVGGRVLPMFTANGTRTPKVEPWVWLDRSSLAALWMVFFCHFFHLQVFIPTLVMSGLFTLASVLTALRVARLKIWLTRRTPLLWSLHLAYWCIPLGFALFAARYQGLAVSHSLALHTLTVGGMGGMILAMMARVSLGHTGRMLVTHPMMSAAFMAMIMAAVCRVAVPLIKPELYVDAVLLAACLWCLGFGCFVAIYFRILTSPRVDGHPG